MPISSHQDVTDGPDIRGELLVDHVVAHTGRRDSQDGVEDGFTAQRQGRQTYLQGMEIPLVVGQRAARMLQIVVIEPCVGCVEVEVLAGLNTRQW